ncbi:hypothetical protein GA0074695_4293 [Micromonospora viridifaciens]|uniref:Uncharacterized protein n=1 Tax=Micromonospora viridifaciens TaxID=1881 RepID=A0A1C4YHJ2_MICVI|nr:hypothetical protein [Micromonospora viridifaciens]SCF20193.1 hypothetical protein GA0074695_4293 [Micromonospora viridifaciens]
MSTSLLGWIAVPGGRVEKTANGTEHAVLRVLMVPRLQEQLAGTALEDWPKAVNQAVPVVEIEPPGEQIREVPSTLRVLADSDVWRGFFGHGIQVNPWQPPTTPPAPTVSRTLQHADAVTRAYAAAADSVADPAVTKEQLAIFHGPADVARAAAPEPAFPKVDFHRAVSLLREHPHVLTMLGLILELDLTAADIPHSDADSAARVRVRWPASPVPVESPWTAYEFGSLHFLPASSGDIRSGQLDLADDDKWQVITVDVDGAVGKLRETAHALLGSAEADPPAVLPTLRSAGLQLARTNRSQILADKAAQGRSNLAKGSLTDRVYTADDLVLGYRVDVRPQKSNTWFSLHCRQARYTVDGLPIGPPVVTEEGHLKPHAAVQDGTGLRTDEIVARWDGWSLAVRRPTFDGRPAMGSTTDAARDLIPYTFRIDFDVVPGSLPELRFGKAYQLRARVVDMAGGGLRVDDPDAAKSPTAEIPYTRYEPVPPPEVVTPENLLVPDRDHPGKMLVDEKRLGPGGTVERLVVRTSPTPAGFSPAEFIGDPAYPANDRRSVVAPSTTFQLAEQHGVFSVNEETGWRRAVRSAGLAPDQALPDPMSLGAAAALLAEPGGLTETVTDARPWAGAWPDHEPKHIELVPGDRNDKIALRWLASGNPVAPSEDAQSTTVRVTVPPGEHVMVELSSAILQDHLDWFSLKKLISAPEADLAAITGRHPMLTPPRRLELVHAVRKPLAAPTGSWTTERPEKSTYAVLRPHDKALGLHTPSTAQLTVQAAWCEWGDAAEPTPAAASLPPVTISYGATELPEIRQEFGDTKHRMICYTATAISRYRAMFAEPDPDNDAFQVSTTFDAVSIKSSVRPGPPTIVATVPAFSWSDAPRPGGGLVRTRSSGRLRVELARPWFTTGEGECVAVLVWPGTEDDIPPAVKPLVSWINRDPIHPTPSPKALADESMFREAVDPLDVVLVETGDKVRALPYPVFFHDGRWYADIAIPGAAQSSYAPFAHLALARFQRESLDGHNLSTVTHTDMVPLLPDRNLDIHQDGDGLHIHLNGLNREGDRPNRVTATLEHCDTPEGVPVDIVSLTGALAGLPAWIRVPGASVTGTTSQPLPVLPVPDSPGRLRVIVRESEDLPANVAGLVNAARELTERTVYLDAVPLPVV